MIDENKRRCVSIIYKNPEINFHELRKKMNNIDSGELSRYLDELQNKGYINCTSYQGDVYSIDINSVYIKELIAEELLPIDQIIIYEDMKREKLQNEIDELQGKLNSFRQEVEEVRNVKNQLVDAKDSMDKSVQYNEKRVKDVEEKLNSNLIKNIEVMGVFLAIFSVIGIDIKSLDLYTGLMDLQSKIHMIIVVNVSLVASIVILVILIKFFIVGKSKK